MGEIYLCDFSAAAVRGFDADIFLGVRARNCDATAVGGRRILVLFVGRGAVANSFLRVAATHLDLRVRARTYPRALGVVHGWSREPVPCRSRRRTRGNQQ